MSARVVRATTRRAFRPGERRSGLDVRVTGGVVRGVREGPVIAWRGIPYAAAPSGRLRFRSPGPVAAWTGIRDGSEFGPVAPQAFRGQFRGAGPDIPASEDCLSINVLTVPSAADRTSRRGKPVMVFIHGGGYSAGSSRDFSGQGEGFVHSGEVVFVSFNYRLGALGYLDFSTYSTRSRRFESNLGLRDQVAALQWVQRNIAAFGGDAGRVTIFGESAGGNAVTTLMATPAARGLFARAIAQSAPASAVYRPSLTASWAGQVLDFLRSEVAAELAEAEPGDLLTLADAPSLIRATLRLQIQTPDRDPGRFCLAPVVDGKFLPEYPLDAFRAGRAHRVPLIIGTNQREGSIFRGRVDILPRTPQRIRSLFGEAPAGAREPMMRAYPGLSSRRVSADFGGDFGFWFPSVKVAEYHSRFSLVHCYRFDFAPRLLRVVGLDATHGVEMFALFGSTDVPLSRAMTALGGAGAYEEAGSRMRGNWLRFARGTDLSEDWPAYRLPERRTLVINAIDSVVSDPASERRKAWEAFLPGL
jgi:para-nitrobenzyl esterase